MMYFCLMCMFLASLMLTGHVKREGGGLTGTWSQAGDSAFWLVFQRNRPNIGLDVNDNEIQKAITKKQWVSYICVKHITPGEGRKGRATARHHSGVCRSVKWWCHSEILWQCLCLIVLTICNTDARFFQILTPRFTVDSIRPIPAVAAVQWSQTK